MRKGNVNRRTARSGDSGTFSDLIIYAKDSDAITLQLVLGELPPRGDAHNLSCLPPMLDEGAVTYVYRYEYSNAHGKNNYRAIGVLNADGSIGPMPGGRDACELHAANLMGDILKGFGAQVDGCGGPGEEIVVFPNGAPFKSFTAASPTTLVPVQLSQPQTGVAASGEALAALEHELAGEDVALTYAWI